MGTQEVTCHQQQRCEAYYEGHVQGVGFRYSTQRIAARYAVTGYVRNLADGRVHVVAEGDADEVRAFLNEVSLALSDHIRKVTTDRTSASGEFTSFSIRY